MRDLALLRDLKQAAQIVIERYENSINSQLLIALNSAMIHSASIEPGKLRQGHDKTGVTTGFGRHEPPAVDHQQLEQIVRDTASRATDANEVQREAANLFLAVAKAQPFKDGNKRSAIFAANALLLHHHAGVLLTIPHSDTDPSIALNFNQKLARAYIYDEDETLVDTLLSQGLTPAPDLVSRSIPAPDAASEAANILELKAKIAKRTPR